MSDQDAENTILTLDTKFFTENVITLPESTPLSEVFRAVAMSPSKTVLISEDHEINKLRGVITADDVKNTQDASKKTVSDLIAAHGQLTAVFDKAQLWQVLKIMNGENSSEKALNAVPVVDKDGRVQGIISRDGLTERLSSVDKIIADARSIAPGYN